MWDEPDEDEINVFDAYSSKSPTILSIDDSSTHGISLLSDNPDDSDDTSPDLFVLDVAYPWCNRCARLRTAFRKATESLRVTMDDNGAVFGYVDARENPLLRHHLDTDACLGGPCKLLIRKKGEPDRVLTPPEPIHAQRLLEEFRSLIGPLIHPLPSATAIPDFVASVAAQDKGTVVLRPSSSDPLSWRQSLLQSLIALSSIHRRDWRIASLPPSQHSPATTLSLYPKPSEYDTFITLPPDNTLYPGNDRTLLGITLTRGETDSGLGDPIDPQALASRIVMGTQPVFQEFNWNLKTSADKEDLHYPMATVWVNVSAPEHKQRIDLVQPLGPYVTRVVSSTRASLLNVFCDAGQAFMLSEYHLDPSTDLPSVGIKSPIGSSSPDHHGLSLADLADPSSSDPDTLFESGAQTERSRAALDFFNAFLSGELERSYMSRPLEDHEVAQNQDPTMAMALNQDLLLSLLARMRDPNDALQDVLLMVYRGWHTGLKGMASVMNKVAHTLHTTTDPGLSDAVVVGVYDGAGNTYDPTLFLDLDVSGNAPVLYTFSMGTPNDDIAVERLMAKDIRFTLRSVWSWLKTHSPLLTAHWPAVMDARRNLVAARKAAEAAKQQSLETAPKLELGLGAYKQVLQPGPDPDNRPSEGDRILVRHEMRGTEGEFIERTSQSPYIVELGQGQVVICLDAALSTMAVGERAHVFCPSSAGFGSIGSPDKKVPPDTDIVFDVHIVGIKERFRDRFTTTHHDDNHHDEL